MTSRRVLSFTLPLAIVVLLAIPMHGANLGKTSIEPASSFPTLAVPAVASLTLRLGTRRREVCVDELVSFDVAVLNTSKEPLYVRKIFPYSATLDVVDSADDGVMIFPVMSSCGIAALEDLALVQPGNILTGSFQYVLGCDNERDIAASKAQTELTIRYHEMTDETEASAFYDTSSFNQGLFVTDGLGCIAIRRPGTYSIVAEHTNAFVVKTSRSPRHRSAVGTLRSEPLKLKVCDCIRQPPPAQPN